MLLIVLGLIALILGAELLVRGASKLAFDIPVMVAVACGPVFFTGNRIAC